MPETVATTTEPNTVDTAVTTNTQQTSNHTDTLEDGEVVPDNTNTVATVQSKINKSTKYKSTVIYNAVLDNNEQDDPECVNEPNDIDDTEYNDNNITDTPNNLLSLGVDAWDDSVLIEQWNNTIKQYKQLHHTNNNIEDNQQEYNNTTDDNNNNHNNNIVPTQTQNGKKLSNRDKKRLRQQQQHTNKIQKLLSTPSTLPTKQSTILDQLISDDSKQPHTNDAVPLHTNGDIQYNNNQIDDNNNEQTILHNLTQSWYNTGYWTGRLHALQHLRQSQSATNSE